MFAAGSGLLYTSWARADICRGFVLRDARDEANSLAEVAKRVPGAASCACCPFGKEDWLEFRAESVCAAEIREEQDYGGIRISIEVCLGKACVAL